MPNGLAGSAQVSYPLVAPSGTAGAPSYSFAASPTSGMYLVSANEVGFSIGGTGVWYFNSSGLLLPYADNSYDIGISILRPRSVYAGTSFLAPAGSAASPSFSFASVPTSGIFYWAATAGPTLTAPGSQIFLTCDGNLGTNALVSGLSFAAYGGSSGDLILTRDAADILAQRRTTNAQTFRLYQSFTDSGNYTRVNLGWDGAGFLLGLTAAGTGNPNQSIRINANQAFLSIGPSGGFIFGSDALNWWNINSSGHLLAVTDNVYDIGANGATRPRTVYAATGFSTIGTAEAQYFQFTSNRGYMQASADGVWVYLKQAGSDFNRLCFGGVTNLYPSIKRDGANLALVPADGSAGYIDLTVHDVIGSSVYLSNLVGVGANNTNIGLSLTGFAMNIHNSAAALTLAVTGGATLATFAGTGYLEMYEVTAPAAPGANAGRLYFEDNGAGKTRLMCLFGSGAAQQIAIEP